MVVTRRGAETGTSGPSTIDAMADGNPIPSRSPAAARTSPYLPTPLERAALAIFPVILLFGALFSILSPHTRHAPYDRATQAHSQDPAFAPSYFARKSNLFNVLFVKQGWAWLSVTFAMFLLTHPATATATLRVRGAVRWGVVTAWWFLVTQWCFGPPLIDRGFRWTGGKCELAGREVVMGDTSVGEMVTAVACKAAGGKWQGGHDISGHVFLLVLSTAFLMEEVGWPVLRWSGWRPDERAIVMPDGAIKGAAVEAETRAGEGRGEAWLGLGGKFAAVVMGLNLWMLLMTAIYFHTWVEKFTGLWTAAMGFYVVYIIPRFVPAVRSVVGLPGV
ncbi:FIT family protein-like protein [Hapsidospora chrysogenum ATCC 11550]|uniref:Acyl-coenzyme A diphosphatase SCS3 n=1 Tax=Hapsidospora chrysogenum (strain ATCC 11550 / CBS 779.69 / DSM 880 / IAM 14645 / JCM 23072 / IMI 49137) TaxID=857340 RepID=A0A086THL2_HAPC1|nr:FIT family protein-like protein [Hapsidospora chrysogenum ATCC 11550]